MVSEVDEFLGDVVPRQMAAERALLQGEVEPWMAAWSSRDPVTLFGAAVRVRCGWDEVTRVFRWLASRFSDVSDYRLDVVAAGVSGDLAYTVGFEHKTVCADGEQATYTLRVTHVYRREDGKWKIVHRHGDHPPADAAPVLESQPSSTR
ncbi:MAG TPA: nuclear transport factor 2 family protein [Pseudonocardia sp.]|jgi:ketosteroid isomerase-like protein|nr:nuclear transport factor 2 family protein [Pseudonocardia sp.]